MVPITGRIVNEKTGAPVYKAEIFILESDLKVKTSETGSFNFLANKQNLPDIITLFIARYEYESKSARIILAKQSKKRPTISIARYFSAPEVLNWPQLSISGNIIDEKGKPLKDVAIYASSTTGHTYSDGSGGFTLQVNQMRPGAQPTLWFCKRGFKSKQIGLHDFRKRNVIRLNKTTSLSKPFSISYRDADSDLLEAVHVVFDGTIRDSTGVLGSVVLSIEVGSIQTIRVSHRYYFKLGGVLRRVGGSKTLNLQKLQSELIVELNPDYKFVPASGFPAPSILECSNSLPQQDSLLIAELGRFRELRAEEVPLELFSNINKQEVGDEITDSVKGKRLESPVRDLPPIHISGPFPPELSTGFAKLANLSDDSLKAKNVSTRSAKTIRKALGSHNNAIQYCYKRALKKNPHLKGTLELRFILAPEGKIEHAEIIHSSLADLEMEQCILELVQRWRNFPPVDPGVGSLVYRIPYSFGM